MGQEENSATVRLAWRSKGLKGSSGSEPRAEHSIQPGTDLLRPNEEPSAGPHIPASAGTQGQRLKR